MISNSVKKRLVQVFQEIFLKHPIFNKVHVVTKFPDKERFKHMLLIRSVSGSAQRISMDNFVATSVGYSALANLKGVIGNSIEWVKDDTLNHDKMSSQGFYVVRITDFDENTQKYKFMVDPYQIVEEELAIKFIKQHDGAMLSYTPINPGSLSVYTEDGLEFKPEIDYTIDYDTGELLFTNDVKDYEPIMVEYQVIGEQRGPYDIMFYEISNTAIPGVVIAFGDRIRVGDEQVVVVEKQAREMAKIYGGRWEMSVDIIGIAQDPDQQERMVDYAVSMFWAEWQDRLVGEGINVFDFSLSGEAEDLEIDTPEEYSFTGGISCTVQTDWELAVPLIATYRRMNVAYGQDSFKRALTDNIEDAYEAKENDPRMIGSLHQRGLIVMPFIEPVVTKPSMTVSTRKYS